MKYYLQGLKWYLPGLILGLGAGYVYYYFWGCNGSCLITSSSVNSMLYGAVMGALFNSLFKPNRKQAEKPKEEA